jgi:hypothetical protein
MVAKSVYSHNRWENESHFYCSQIIHPRAFLRYMSQDRVWRFVSSWILDLYQKTFVTLSTSNRGVATYRTTYLCEKTLSTIVIIKPKYRNRLQLESDLWVAVSTIQPRMRHLVSDMQAHPSHWVSTVSHSALYQFLRLAEAKVARVFLGRACGKSRMKFNGK